MTVRSKYNEKNIVVFIYVFDFLQDVVLLQLQILMINTVQRQALSELTAQQ